MSRSIVVTACVLSAWLATAAWAQDRPAPATESSAPEPAAALSGAALRAALQRGGLVVYFRHAATDPSRNDTGMTGYADCERQRPLSAQGRQEATAIGRSIRALRLPADERLASPFCRTLDHARLMLGDVTPRAEVREAGGDGYDGLKQLLSAPVAAGSNRWIVGHGTPFRAVAGPPHLAEGEAAVLRPGGSGWTVVARLSPTDWPALAAAR